MMLARLGNVLYWLGCILAGFAVICAIAMVVIPSNPNDTPVSSGLPIVFAVGAFMIWLIGRALRYILAGR
jgi:hypothetical protein